MIPISSQAKTSSETSHSQLSPLTHQWIPSHRSSPSSSPSPRPLPSLPPPLMPTAEEAAAAAASLLKCNSFGKWRISTLITSITTLHPHSRFRSLRVSFSTLTGGGNGIHTFFDFRWPTTASSFIFFRACCTLNSLKPILYYPFGGCIIMSTITIA
ncbi:hypothetical protein BC826DRAFT_81311 [Russula brevipes]|nr:hypothetical protein BC826DRAFT_81311 [Russula brevipes]